MIKSTLVTKTFYDDNKDEIHASAAKSGIGRFEPVLADNGLLLCQGVNANDLSNANIFSLPEPLQEEGTADYRARIAIESVAGLNAVKNNTKNVFAMWDKRYIHQCRKMDGWPVMVSEV